LFWTPFSFTVSINTHFAGIARLWAKESNLAGHGRSFGTFFDTVFTARRYYCSFVKKGIDQGRREDLNGGELIRSFFVTTDHITAIAAKLENIETVKL